MSPEDTNPFAELEERLRFETLTAELSSRFVNALAGEVDREIMEALRRICQSLAIDFAALWQWSDEASGFLMLTHYHRAQEGPGLPERANGSVSFPWVHQEMLAGRTVVVSSLAELPREAARDLESARQLGIQSNLTLPLSVGGGPVIGALGFNTTQTQRDWPDALVKRLQLVGQILANALARKRADRALRESEERLSLAAEAAGLGVWRWNVGSGEVWGSPRWMELFGFTADERATFEKTVERIHADDRKRVVAGVRRSLDGGSQFAGDFRVVLPDGTIRWINSRGKPYPGPDGKPDRMLGAAIDATERKRGEESMRASKARLEAGSDLAGLGHYEIDYGARTCFLDERFRQICGVPEEVKQGLDPVRFWSEHVHPDDRQFLLDEREKLHEGKIGQISAEYRYLHPVFGERWIHHLARLAARATGDGGARTFGVIRDITEARLMSERIQSTAAEWQTTFDSISDMVMILDREYRIIRVNAATARFLGLPMERIVGSQCCALMHGTPCPVDECPGKKTFETAGPSEFELFHAGSGKWLRLTTDGIRDAAGSVSGVVHVARDISEQKRLADQQAVDLRFVTLIAELSSRFVNLPASQVDREILDALRSICAVLDLDLTAVWQWSESGPGRFIATHFYNALQGPQSPGDLKHEDYPWLGQQLLAGRLNVFASLDDFPAEAAVDRENCRRLGIKSHLSLPLAIGGQPTFGILGLNTARQERAWPEELVNRMQLVAQIFASAIARKRAELALRESEEINRATFEQAAVGIAHVGTDGRWLQVNDKLCAIVGYSRGELMRLTFQDITHPDDLETDLDYVRQMLAGEIKTYSMEKRYFRKDRSLVWIDLTVSLVRTMAGEPKHFISVVQDITDRKNAEAEALRQRTELAHIARVSTMGELAASMAHELNQPLGAILANAEAAELFLEQNPPALTELGDILAAIRKDDERAAEVIRRMRALLRKRELDRQPIEVNSLVQDVCHLVGGDAALRGVSLASELAPGLPPILGDRVHLQQVLLNLILNGMDAVGDLPRESRRLSVSTCLAAGRQVEIVVADSGPGIGPEKVPRLFEPFYTTKPDGMGMGLSIARTIVEAHRGRIWAESRPGGGAVFRIALPVARMEGGSGFMVQEGPVPHDVKLLPGYPDPRNPEP